MLWVSEHGTIVKADSNAIRPDGNLQLGEADFESVLSLLEESDAASDSDMELVFRYSQPRGRPQLKVRNYVGLIRTGSGTHIEVLPKLAKAVDSAKARELLVRMLIELEDSPFLEARDANLEAFDMPLFEILIRYFLQQVADIVRKGIARTYVEEEGDLAFLRGKLVLSEQVTRNSINAAQFYCRYDEYQADRPINRLIRAGLNLVSQVSTDPLNQQRCRELLFWFDSVPPSADIARDFSSIRKDRLIQHYFSALPSCRMILEGLNPLTQKGDDRAISMLFPMERVFEDFVTAKLRRQLPDWKLKTQSRARSLVEDHRGRKMFTLIPDLLLSKGRTTIVADTKWKLINERMSEKKYGIAQSDIYQLFAYSKKYLEAQEEREVYLIYPASESFSEPLQPFWYEEGGEALYVIPYDLDAERLLIPEESCLQDV